VDREEAKDLLRHAEVVVLASDDEGFGLPLAEALACGAACVASDAPALVEVAGGAAVHFPRGDVGALAAALAAVLEPEARRRLQAAARARAVELAWEKPVSAWRELLSRVAGGQPGPGELRMPGDGPSRH
jgi:glycosyltransferase involved in cell wall biosynthesis